MLLFSSDCHVGARGYPVHLPPCRDDIVTQCIYLGAEQCRRWFGACVVGRTACAEYSMQNCTALLEFVSMHSAACASIITKHSDLQGPT